MVIYPQCSETFPTDTNFDNSWNELYPILRVIVKRFVYSSRNVKWRGQEEDMIEDILQETALRLFERIQKATCGEASPIKTIKGMAISIAYNHCVDLLRRDYRLTRLDINVYGFQSKNSAKYPNEPDLTAEATDNVYKESLFCLLAQEIAKFPMKQRKALLVDLANCMSFDEPLTPLQTAFFKTGISLYDYRQPLSNNSTERRRHSALLHCAYKRIAQLTPM